MNPLSHFPYSMTCQKSEPLYQPGLKTLEVSSLVGMTKFEVFRFAVLLQLSAYAAAALPLAHLASSPSLTLVSSLTPLEDATQRLNSTGATNSRVK